MKIKLILIMLFLFKSISVFSQNNIANFIGDSSIYKRQTIFSVFDEAKSYTAIDHTFYDEVDTVKREDLIINPHLGVVYQIEIDNKNNIYSLYYKQIYNNIAYRYEENSSIAKRDGKSNVIWNKHFSNSFFPRFSIDNNNNIIMCGSCNNDAHLGFVYDSIELTKDTQAFIAKINGKNGKLIFIKNSTLAWQRDFSINSICVDNSNNIIVSGSNTVFDNHGYDLDVNASSLDGKLFLNKFNNTGDKLWRIEHLRDGKNFETDSIEAYANSVTIDKKNNIYLSGTIGMKDDSMKYNHYYTPSCLLKYNSDGKLVWMKKLGIADGYLDFDPEKQIAIDNSSNIYVVGNFMRKKDDFNDLNFSDDINLAKKYWFNILKFDSSGNLIFAKKLDSCLYGISIGQVLMDSKNNLYISGSNQCGTIFNGKKFMGNFFIASFDSNSNFKWILGTNIQSIMCISKNDILYYTDNLFAIKTENSQKYKEGKSVIMKLKLN